MNDTPTRTDEDRDHALQPDAVVPSLVVILHADRRLIGSGRVLHPGVVLLLGRVNASLPGVFDDDLVSREHARVTWSGEQGALEDLGSRNGTFLNGRRIARSEPLRVGDVVRVGRVLAMVLMRKRAPMSTHPTLLGIGEAMGDVREQIALVGPTDTTVLVLGETGVGKELVAEAVHAASQRSGRCVAINCAAVPDGVLASELFGHARGAFSGAQAARPGLVEAARGGTLFLDEIGDASPAMQQSLLRLLERREYRALGSDHALTTDARFIAAAQPQVHEAIARGSFRQDLWMRLARWIVRVPPLHARREDVPLLAAVFAERAAGHVVMLDPDLAERLVAHAWPGNVRELQSIIERIVVGARGATRLQCPPWLAGELATVVGTTPKETDPGDDEPDAGRRRAVPRPAREALATLLAQHAGNVVAVATALGVRRSTLYRWLSQLALDPESFRPSEP